MTRRVRRAECGSGTLLSFQLEGSATMSSSPTPPVSTPNVPSIIRIYSHSSLFYWWPVWALGFLLTIITWWDGDRIIHVPYDTEISKSDGSYKLSRAKDKELKDEEKKLPQLLDKHTPPTTDQEKETHRVPPRLSHRNWMGATYCIVLLIVIMITNVPLRGLWSVITIVTIVLLSVIFGLAGWWDDIFFALGGLHIFVGMAGYLFISIVLFIMWFIVMMVFDRQIYITFQAGQMKVCEEVGGGEKSYDTQGMSIEKHRDDLFRHWVLGLGSGDLTVRTSGATPHQITMPNVLFIGKKLKQIEDMQREKQVVQ
jgi:hypothetical protein